MGVQDELSPILKDLYISVLGGFVRAENVDPRRLDRIGDRIISWQVKNKGVDKDADVLADRGFRIAYGLSQYKRTNDYSWLRVAQNNIDAYNRIIGRLNCAQWTLAC